MRHLITCMIAFAIVSAPFHAAAQEAASPAAATIPVASPSVPSPVTLRVGGAFITGHAGETEASRADVSTGLGLDVGQYVTLYADVHFGTTWFSYGGMLEDGLRVNTTLWSHFDLSLGAGLVLHPLRREHVELDVFGEFEGSVARTSPTVTSLDVTTPQGSYDVAPYARNNTNLSFSWYRVALGPTIRGRWDWFSPSFTLAFEYLHGTLDSGLTDDSRLVLTRLGYDAGRVEREHSVSQFHVSLIPGVEFHLSPHDRLGFSGLIGPGGDGWTFGGSVAFVHGF